MHAADLIAPIAPADLFAATAQRLSTLRFKTIVRLTIKQPLVRAAAVALRREARGQKLGRRMHRKVTLGMAGAF